MLVIVIAVVCLILFFVCRVYNNTSIDASEEEAFKLNVYQYYLQVENYKKDMAQNNSEFNSNDLNAYGAKIKAIIPDIIETDLSKFKIEHGKLIYIGISDKEKQWTEELRI